MSEHLREGDNGLPPQPRTHSCLFAKLSHFCALGNAERDLIMKLEDKERVCRRGDTVWRQGQPANSLYVVKSGWMYGYAILGDGKRQVLDIYLPGDVLGLRDIVFEYSVSSVSALNDAILCPFPKSAMDDVFIEAPRLATLLYSLGMLENIVVIDRLKAAASLDARQRLCFFLMQIFARLSITNPMLGAEFKLPMTQELIGDALGLTQAHVNRTIHVLEEEGLIRRDGTLICILDGDRMRDISGFENRHYKMDLSWFPSQ